jgi:hypothetical protein
LAFRAQKDKIAELNHKNKIIIFFDVVYCGLKYGAGYIDYYQFQMYKMNREERKTIITRGINNSIIKKYNDQTAIYKFENKALFNKLFIRYKVAGQRSSIWIAQRNGRTKDGIDLTEQGLLKMLDMSGSGDFVKDMEALDILPVAISYEYEPCDAFKTHELYVSRRQKYVKGEDEDYNSILTGLTQWKGNIHFEFTEPVLPKEVEYCSQFSKNERFQELAKIIDRQIHTTYRLWPNNYIAADLLAVGEGGSAKGKYSDHYNPEQKAHFEEYAAKQLSTLDGDAAELREIFLGIYANPVKSQEK